MIGMLSYWKTTCSPEILIKPHNLNESQLRWWKNLYFNGLGEFFYLNGIRADFDSFVNFKCFGNNILVKEKIVLGNANLIPVGGGKDSALSYELLCEAHEDNMIFFLNPQHLPIHVVDVNDRENKIVIAQREISPALLEMNKNGFLNGHTPFSALLAFLSLLISALTSRKNIILSNESSANEPTVAGSLVNHQYSKTIAFEGDFRNYVSSYIAEGFNYFSFLRPVNELQIAFMFSEYKHFFKKFRSCNAGSKKGIWCCKCPKCLFTYIILSPFLNEEDLNLIFGQNLFENNELKTIFNQLTGKAEIKPFDCIGTVEEVNTALVMTIKRKNQKNLPSLLKYYFEDSLYSIYDKNDFKKLLTHFNKENFLSQSHLKIIKEALRKRFIDVYKEKISL